VGIARGGEVKRSACVLSLGVLAGSIVPSGAAGQHVVEGRIVGSSGGMPIEDVTVRAVGEGLVVGTDSAGFFRFELPEDRPGVAIAVEVIGYRPFERTWILPLSEPIRIGLQQEAVELAGIDVDVNRGGMSGFERLEYRVRSIPGGIPRTAGTAELRAFANQNAEILDFFPAMTVATGVGCESCLMASGRFDPDRWLIDDREVFFDEFRSYPVGEICRVDVVTIPVTGSPVERGVVLAYTCRFLRDVASGKETLRLLMTDLWGP
jgi:hypothetical protein